MSNLLKALQGANAPVSEDLFKTESLGTHPIAEFGTVQTSSNGKLFYKVGDYRINVKPEALTKTNLEVVIFTANKAFKSMVIGDKFIVAQ